MKGFPKVRSFDFDETQKLNNKKSTGLRDKEATLKEGQRVQKRKKIPNKVK